MTHLASPYDAISPAQGELAGVLSARARKPDDSLPLGLPIETERGAIVVLIVAVVDFEADGWWSR